MLRQEGQDEKNDFALRLEWILCWRGVFTASRTT